MTEKKNLIPQKNLVKKYLEVQKSFWGGGGMDKGISLGVKFKTSRI